MPVFTKTTLLGLFGIALIATIVVGALFFSTQSKKNSDEIAGQNAALSIAKQAQNDLQTAVQSYQATLVSESATPRVVESTTLAGAPLEYVLTADHGAAIKSTQELKKIAAKPDTRPFIKASAIQLIAQMYYLTGTDESVFKEIFKDDPYKAYLVTTDGSGNQASSIRELLKYSYSIHPTYSAAVDLARLNVLRLYWVTGTRTSNPELEQRLTLSAEQNLAHADDLVGSKQYEQPNNPNAHVMYLSERANILGGLAHFVGAPYAGQYKQAYEDFFAYAAGLHNPDVDSFVANMRFWYAMHLVQVDNDSETAREQLKLAITDAQKSPLPTGNSLVQTIRTIKNSPTSYQLPVSLTTMTTLSAEFKTFVDGIK